MSQSRAGSLVEAIAGVCIGFGINFAGNLLVLPLFGFNVRIGDAVGIGVIFTIISIARTFFVRRMFNGLRRWNDGT